MGVRAEGLTAAKVRTAAPGRYGDGDGLYLFVRKPEAAFWVFRFTRGGKMREMGLGRARGANAVRLAEARVKAGELHRSVRAGRDPLADREAEKIVAQAEAQNAAIAARTFRHGCCGSAHRTTTARHVDLMVKQARLQGLMVGSRRQQQDYVAALEQSGVRPVLDSSYWPAPQTNLGLSPET